MKVQVYLGKMFANSGKNLHIIEMAEGSTVMDLCTKLVDNLIISKDIVYLEEIGEEKLFGNLVVVNNEIAQPTNILENNDKVTILPQLTGG
jgi:molybdopterin converting factor small subunit